MRQRVGGVGGTNHMQGRGLREPRRLSEGVSTFQDTGELPVRSEFKTVFAENHSSRMWGSLISPFPYLLPVPPTPALPTLAGLT